LRNCESHTDEIRVLRLQPIAAAPALIEAARPLRHDAFKAQLARLGERDRAAGASAIGLDARIIAARAYVDWLGLTIDDLSGPLEAGASSPALVYGLRFEPKTGLGRPGVKI